MINTVSKTKNKYCKLILYSPCICTSLNLLMGITVIFLTVHDRLNASKFYLPLFIIAACFFDWIDGKIARKVGVASEFGKQLDSFADYISFGIAPVVLILHYIIQYSGLIGIFASICFSLAGVFRLARFNITKSNGDFFEGLPIAVAGVLIAMKHLVIMQIGLQGNAAYIDAYLTSVLMITLSILMVSKIRVKKI